MANNLRVFNLINDYNEAELVKPSVSFVVENGKVYYDDVPSPTFQGKWLATYSDSHTESAECDSSSAITKNEINKTNLVSVEIGDCVTSIGDKVFYNCRSLTNINIPSGVTTIGEHTFANCRSLTSINIPSGVTSIGGYAFAGCESLTSVTIPSGVTTIGGSAFNDCTSLTSVDIPSGVTSIGGGAFNSCYGLTSIDIPNSVTTIGEYTFANCRSLTSITIEATTPPRLGGKYTFATNYPYMSRGCPIYVPSQSVNAYKTAEGWSDYASRIQPIP